MFLIIISHCTSLFSKWIFVDSYYVPGTIKGLGFNHEHYRKKHIVIDKSYEETKQGDVIESYMNGPKMSLERVALMWPLED